MKSCMLPYTSEIAAEVFFFRLTHLEYEFMLASLVRLNLVVLKIWECPRSLPPAVL